MSSEEQEIEVNSGAEHSSGDEQPKKRRRIDSSYPGTQVRGKPKVLVDALASMKPAQKNAVREMGFGSLFSMKFEDFNNKLTYWLVENFNPLSSELVFDDGRRVHIESEDVGRLLGFPNGDVAIERKKKSGRCALYDEWKTMFPNFQRVTAGDLAVRMMECVDGGDWFRRHFVTLVDSVLIGNLQCGYINPLILDCLDDVSIIRDFNWWDYTLNTLISKRVRWDGTNKIEFNGPVLLLTVFYLDRVCVLGRDVPRTIPAMASWTMDKFKERVYKEFKHGGFGQGYVQGPYLGGPTLQPQLERLVTGQEKQSSHPGPSSAGRIGQQDYIGNIKARIACLASDVVEIISLIRDAPSDVVEVPEFSEIGVVAQNLICHKSVQVEGTRDGEDLVGSEIQQAEAFWSNPDNIALLEKMEAAICKRDEFEKWKADRPSFSLGLTQEQNNAKWDAVLGTSRLYAQEEEEKEDDEEEKEDDEEEKEDDDEEKEDDEQEEALIVDGGKGAAVPGKEGAKKNNEKLNVYRRNEPRQKKKTQTLTSPFVERQVDVMSRLNEQQNMIVKWLFENPEAEKDEAIFKAGHMTITREDFVTMRPGSYLSVSLIDVWTKILNAKESVRSKGSPLRFFATTYSTMYSVVSPSEPNDDNKNLALFSQSLDAEFGDVNPTKLQAFDMFFFPICKSEHLFVVVFDMKRKSMQILDNSSVGGTKLDKYEDVPAKLVRAFSQYMTSKGCVQMGQEIGQLTPTRISMPWRDARNKVDCGIFAMRHMETYMGGGMRGWTPGLRKGDANLMCTFRSKYVGAIFLDDMNELRGKNLAECKKHWTGKKPV